MAGGCCGGCDTPPTKDEAWRRVLWIALAINAGTFAATIAADVAAHSAALKADALDFLGDAANYAISIGVAGLALRWRAQAALLKGGSLSLLGLWVGRQHHLDGAGRHVAGARDDGRDRRSRADSQSRPRRHSVAAPRRRRQSSVRVDMLAQQCDRRVAVVAAALGVFDTGTAWPDIAVAIILAGLGVSGEWQIVREARCELRSLSVRRAPIAA